MKKHHHDGAMNDVQPRREVGEFEMHTTHHVSTIPPSRKDKLMTSKSSLFEVDVMIMILLNEPLPSYFLHSATKHSKERQNEDSLMGSRINTGVLTVNTNHLHLAKIKTQGRNSQADGQTSSVILSQSSLTWRDLKTSGRRRESFSPG